MGEVVINSGEVHQYNSVGGYTVLGNLAGQGTLTVNGGSFTCDACQKVAAILALLDALGMPDGATCAEWLAFDLKRDEVTRLVRELRQLGGC